MAVYVDLLFQWGNERSPRCFRRQPSCHMYGDTEAELHQMALAIGMKRSWFQPDSILPHYDLVPFKRRAAVERGAIEHDRKRMAAFVRERSLKAKALNTSPCGI